jgi:hypothetical protein
VDQPADELVRVLIDDQLLPGHEFDTSEMLRARPVLWEQAR